MEHVLKTAAGHDDDTFVSAYHVAELSRDFANVPVPDERTGPGPFDACYEPPAPPEPAETMAQLRAALGKQTGVPRRVPYRQIAPDLTDAHLRALNAANAQALLQRVFCIESGGQGLVEVASATFFETDDVPKSIIEAVDRRNHMLGLTDARKCITWSTGSVPVRLSPTEVGYVARAIEVRIEDLS